jgi:hypothetical protein
MRDHHEARGHRKHHVGHEESDPRERRPAPQARERGGRIRQQRDVQGLDRREEEEDHPDHRGDE